MAVIFSSGPGRAVRIPDNIATGMLLYVGSVSTLSGVPPLVSRQDGSFSTYKSLVTEVAIAQRGNYQFLHSLQDMIYVYIFGERIGELQIAGLSFVSTCNDATGATVSTGIERILSYYNAARISATGYPVQILLGATVHGRFRGFLTDLNVNVDRPDVRIARFNLRFRTLQG